MIVTYIIHHDHISIFALYNYDLITFFQIKVLCPSSDIIVKGPKGFEVWYIIHRYLSKYMIVLKTILQEIQLLCRMQNKIYLITNYQSTQDKKVRLCHFDSTFLGWDEE